MEAADAEVQDPGLERSTVVMGDRHPKAFDLLESRRREA
jgi:hypothetical protein